MKRNPDIVFYLRSQSEIYFLRFDKILCNIIFVYEQIKVKVKVYLFIFVEILWNFPFHKFNYRLKYW